MQQMTKTQATDAEDSDQQTCLNNDPRIRTVGCCVAYDFRDRDVGFYLRIHL